MARSSWRRLTHGYWLTSPEENAEVGLEVNWNGISSPRALLRGPADLPLARPVLAEFAEQRDTAASIDGLPGDVACFIGSQKREDAGNLFRRSDTPERDVGFDNGALGRIIGPGCIDRGVDRAGPDRVDANARPANSSASVRVRPAMADLPIE